MELSLFMASEENPWRLEIAYLLIDIIGQKNTSFPN